MLKQRGAQHQELPGFWQGTGFSLIARPDQASPHGIFLQLNLLQETIDFTAIGSPVPNRGSAQGDISIYGVTYLHRVTDAATGGALHIEPGLWLNIPPTTEPAAGPTIARLLTVPHGNAVRTVGAVQEVDLDGIPTLPSISTVPFTTGTEPPASGAPNPYPEFDLETATAFRTSPLAEGITQALVDGPMNAVRQALASQRLTHVTRLITSTSRSGRAPLRQAANLLATSLVDVKRSGQDARGERGPGPRCPSRVEALLLASSGQRPSTS
jgi:hypothetical protein